MIRLTRGDLLEADAEALVNTVNTVGVMGRGIALQFKRAFPENYDAYRLACKEGRLDIGQVFTYDLKQIGSPRYIINMPTKRHWRGKSRLEYIESGLQALVTEIRRLKIRSVALPPLGCGLGGLGWQEVLPRIEAALAGLPDVDVLVYEPVGAPEPARMKTATKRPRMTPGRAALLALIHRYLTPLLDDAVSLLEVHKLMYFMQESGETLKLEFVKGRYGPYATNLHHVLNKIEGHFITGFGEGSEEPGKVIEAQRNATDEAERFLKDSPETLSRFGCIEDLIRGFETPYGMELLSSVHWVARHENPAAVTDADLAVQLVHSWNDRKRDVFKPEHICSAWTQLKTLGWL